MVVHTKPAAVAVAFGRVAHERRHLDRSGAAANML
jgi:hypothetical protein